MDTEEERIMSQPRKMLLSSFTSEKGTLVASLVSFYHDLCDVCTKKHCFNEDTQRMCFNSFVQSAVDATSQKDDNPNSSVVAETRKLLTISSYGYQSNDHRWNTVTKNQNKVKIQAVKFSELLKKLGLVNVALQEIERAKTETEHKEPIIFVFFILEYTILWVLETYCNLFIDFCDVSKFEG